jgi:hypothetical protein
MMLCVLTLMFFGVVAADVLVTYPAGGEVLSGFEEYTITWTESNMVPVISDLDSYIIFLHAGTNENYVCTHSPGDLFSPSDKHKNTISPLAAGSPGTFMQTTNFSNTLPSNEVVGPNSKNNA